MNKYTLKGEHSVIFTRTSDGTEISFEPKDFNDALGDLLCLNNQDHLVSINPQWQNANVTEKKTFKQITDNVILLTSNQEQTEESSPSQTANEPSSKRKRGRQPVNKV